MDTDFHKAIALHSQICTIGAVFCAWSGWKAVQINERALAATATVFAVGLAAFALHVQ